tara:strand:+ start:992 stop:1213 length:222 start_codon:yes stop_codon:yes gene_type:complete
MRLHPLYAEMYSTASRANVVLELKEFQFPKVIDYYGGGRMSAMWWWASQMFRPEMLSINLEGAVRERMFEIYV